MPTPPDVLAPRAPQPLLPVLSAEAMRLADRLTIDDFGIPSVQLMETAGRATAEVVDERYGPARGQSIVCFCGTGNNGGDGLVIARFLAGWGAKATVVILGATEKMSDETARNFRLLKKLAARADEIELLTFEENTGPGAFAGADLYVDAMLGTGLTSAPRPPIDRVVRWLNEQSTPVVAVDIPTGVNSDTGEVLDEAVRADITVTMGALKAGLVLGEGSQAAGTIEIADIGIPHYLVEEARGEHPEGCASLLTDRALEGWLPHRPPGAHKYSAGLALVIAGSSGMTGAPVMASEAAARAGAGFVTCATAEAAQPVVARHLVEATSLALPPAPNGGIDPGGALEVLTPRLEKARALLAGPGLGTDASTQRFIKELLRETDLPAVVDADGLNALAEDAAFLDEHGNDRWVLTPHLGEFKRLAGENVDVSNRITVARAYAQKWQCTLLLKGQPSLVAAPDGSVVVNNTGNAALATAGTGDVLAGMTAGLLAQGVGPREAALSALHLGGACAERYVKTRGLSTMVASDLLTELPYVLRERHHR